MELQKRGMLVLMRHGESCWNELGLFSGWVDIPLSQRGVEESFVGGDKIAEIPFDVIFSSALVRAQMSVLLAMTRHKSGKVPRIHHLLSEQRESWAQIYDQRTEDKSISMFCAWELNERMYGELQGLSKKETIARFGAEQVHLWRRSYDTRPPGGESLADTAARVLPYFHKEIASRLQAGQNVLVCAHGNSLRAILMELRGLSKEQVMTLEIATGEVILASHNDADLSGG